MISANLSTFFKIILLFSGIKCEIKFVQIFFCFVLSYLVSVCVQLTLFGAGTVYLLLASEIIQELLGATLQYVDNCKWFLAFAALLCIPMWLGSPKDFWLVILRLFSFTLNNYVSYKLQERCKDVDPLAFYFIIFIILLFVSEVDPVRSLTLSNSLKFCIFIITCFRREKH